MAGEDQNDRLSLELELQIDALCAEFEELWSKQDRPQIEQFVDRVPERGRSVALVELIAQEVELRRRAGELIEREEYYQRFAQQLAQVDAAFALLHDRNVLNPTDTKRDVDPGRAESVSDAAASSASESDAVPERLGRYTVQSTLGQGAFGVVYLARDTELNRLVALKVPSRGQFRSGVDRERFLEEARAAAQLEHPNIVTVHDVFQEGDRIVIVQQYIEGRDLTAFLASGEPSPAQCARLMATVAEAASVAHQAGFVHRDLKPNNILIDKDNHPHVVDFGLAIHESIQSDRRGESAGTPAYMSPEQVRGETHRLDGRSDLWSAGVILYEMLTGRCPFAGATVDELFDEIKYRDPRPPRQISPHIPAELERICLKCLSKNTRERYTTGGDLAGELRDWLASVETRTATETESVQAQVVPRGLRSFESRDADFFLQLVPGPRDRDGLPESIRFWKARIEETESENTFAVGLVYGPSGCGKSSLVRAGLLPRLKPHVISVYVNAAGTGTECQLLRSLRKHGSHQDADISLDKLLTLVRAGSEVASGHKLLIVVDQFEQWLHANKSEPHAELVSAVRQCDGGRLQCLLVVRDDFWLSVSRFMRAIEIPLVEGNNVALVDLFDPLHARRVLAEFGRAYGRLPDNLGELTRDQELFLDQAVEGLTQEDQINCVRLSLFADMIKGKPWDTATLKKVGGAEGLGLTFLEETFSAKTAPAAHRHHQAAARSVLEALLPDSGTELKGGTRSRQELMEVSGYMNRPEDFAELISILDSTTRLITPADPDAALTEEAQPSDAAERQYFQLTHDYLVPSLRQWLVRKRKETRRGRAELRLADHGAMWSNRPETRFLPSFWEYLEIRGLTGKRLWTPAQWKMMRRAGRYYVTRVATIALLTVLFLWAGWEAYAYVRAAALTDSLAVAETEDVPEIVDRLDGVRRWADPRLEEMLERFPPTSKEHLHASLALLPTDTSQVDYLKGRLLAATPEQVSVLRDLLAPYQEQLREELWSVLHQPDADRPKQILPAASALAYYSPEDDRWANVRDVVVDRLVHTRSASISYWNAALRPIVDHLTPSLVQACRDPHLDLPERSTATDLLVEYAADTPTVMAEAIQGADERQFELFFDALASTPTESTTELSALLSRTLEPEWNDVAVSPNWTDPDPVAIEQIEEAHGMVREQFAFCQTLPLNAFDELADKLHSSGYRPSRVRPYCDGSSVQIAAVWTRDGRQWKWKNGTAEDIREQNATVQRQGYHPEDITGYVVPDADDKTAHFCGLWVKLEGNAIARRMFVGVAKNEIPQKLAALRREGFRTQLRYSTLSGVGVDNVQSAICEQSLDPQGWYAWSGLDYLDQNTLGLRQVEIQLTYGSPLLDGTEFYQQELQKANSALLRFSDVFSARLRRARACYHLSKLEEARDDLALLSDRQAENAEVLELKALTMARLGKSGEAEREFARFLNVLQDAEERASAKAAFGCYSGNAVNALRELDQCLRERAADSGFLYHAARAYAIASSTDVAEQAGQAASWRRRAVQLLGQAYDRGFTDYLDMWRDTQLMVLHDLPEFTALLKRGQLDARYSSIWDGSTQVETVLNHGLTVDKHLITCQRLADGGWRPVCVTALATQSRLTTASFWERPLAKSVEKNLHDRQKANVAVALLRLDQADEVWPLLAHSKRPQLRSYLIHCMSRLGVDPEMLTRRFARESSDSVKRALLLALGEFDFDELPLDLRESFVPELTVIFKNHPDAGLHAAAEWLLRRWGQLDGLSESDQGTRIAKTTSGKPNQERGWYRTSQGQTMVVIEGGQFLMGSPFTEEDRHPSEKLHRKLIQRRFALASSPITLANYREFKEDLKDDILDLITKFPEISLIIPQDDCAMMGMSWYEAAAYCNWLSKKEGIAPEQWCYERKSTPESGLRWYPKYNCLSLSGYRLPTEAEWEYACRAGATTSRYYGDSEDLLHEYAWFLENSQNHIAPVQLLKPNDWGLFDMHGNVWEWCQDPIYPYSTRLRDGEMLEPIQDRVGCVQRGGSYSNPVSFLRCAFRFSFPPNEHGYYNGAVRVARTMPQDVGD